MATLSDQIKNRIVGAVVIVVAFGLMVLFLVKDQKDPIESMAPIPSKPLMPELEVDPVKKVNLEVDDILSEDLTEEVVNQQRKEQIAAQRKAKSTNPDSNTTQSNLSSADATKASNLSTTQASSLNGPVLQTDTGENIAWVLKVGSFAKSSNANSLMEALREKGYRAYVKPPVEGDLYRLFVGPELRKEDIEAFKLEIDKEYRVKSQVL